jgi:hypothetical protein
VLQITPFSGMFNFLIPRDLFHYSFNENEGKDGKA